ncbi:MAG: hypothetical protein FJ333_09835 [Sphingomonadales bacterium]|nr:hypothetical protein [Sphingomonadales bacterium]
MSEMLSVALFAKSDKIFKEPQNMLSPICTFLKSKKLCYRTLAHFQRAKMCIVQMCECAIAQHWSAGQVTISP